MIFITVFLSGKNLQHAHTLTPPYVASHVRTFSPIAKLGILLHGSRILIQKLTSNWVRFALYLLVATSYIYNRCVVVETIYSYKFMNAAVIMLSLPLPWPSLRWRLSATWRAAFLHMLLDSLGSDQRFRQHSHAGRHGTRSP